MQISQERIQAMGKVKGSKVEIQDLKDVQGNALGTKVILRMPFKLKKDQAA